MSGGDQQNGGTPGWPGPNQGPQDAAPQWAQQYPQQPQQPYPQPPYGQPNFPQSPYQQQQQQWAAPKRRSSTPLVITLSAVAVVVIGGIIAAVLFVTKASPDTPATVAIGQTTSASASPAPSSSPAAAQGDCAESSSISDEPVGYHACGTASRDVGVPTYDAAQAKQTYTATIKTNHGDIVFTADGAAAPYTVYSFVYLVQKHYFDNTACHRLTTSSIYVLQCGDPTNTGAGGPGYAFQDENLASLGSTDSQGSVTYKAGTVAMANAGPDTNGSQFFLVYKDSPIAPDYTPFGTITKGLDIIQKVARGGTNNSNGSGDGAPNNAVKIESVTIK